VPQFLIPDQVLFTLTQLTRTVLTGNENCKTSMWKYRRFFKESLLALKLAPLALGIRCMIQNVKTQACVYLWNEEKEVEKKLKNKLKN
jgi:hypothetical protein